MAFPASLFMSLHIILLGTGSPTPSLKRHQPSVFVQWSDGSMLVDVGDGTVSQLLRAGIDLASVENVAFTHLHWDHILGYPALVWGGWSARRSRLRVVGPAGTLDMHRRLVEGYYRDQAQWAMDLGFPREGWDNVEVDDIESGWSNDRGECRIETGAVVHPPMAALAYRFTVGDRSLVISGDTACCSELVEFAGRADLLVVDACAAAPAVDVTPARRAIIERLHEFHASPQDCVEMAAAAEVPRVVLTHHLPEASPVIDARHYNGEVVIGDDLDVLEV
jgi:ribonuclease BN (tRNA processing enzyme)